MAKKVDPFTVRKGAKSLGKLKIGAAEIDLWEQDSEDYHGWHATIPDHRIVVRPGTKAYQAGVILHESIHAIAHLYGFSPTEGNVRCLEQGMLSLMKDNPWLVRDICGAGKARAGRKSGRKV